MESLAGREKAAITPVGWQSRLAVRITNEGGRNTCAVILGVSHPLDAGLIVSNSEGVGGLSKALSDKRLEVVVLVGAPYGRQRKDPLLGQKIVQLKLPELDVQPTASADVVHSPPDCLKVKCRRVIRGWQNIERVIVRESSGCMEVQTAPVEPMSCYLRFSCYRLV